MKQLFNIEDISRHRDALMGVAMLWVMSFHYRLQTPFICKFAGYGYTGVDVFFFLSGLGLYFSMRKNEDTRLFYWKRMKRIFPLFFVLGAIACLLYGSFDGYLWRHTTLGFWTDGVITSWFIPAIVTCYFLYPFFYHAIFKRGDFWLFVFSMTVLLFLVTYKVVVEGKTMSFEGFQPDWWRLMFWYRLPIFLYGSFVGYCLASKRPCRYTLTALLCLIPATILYLQRETMCLNFATSFVSPLIILLMTIAISRSGLVINRIVGGVGKSSLEIFILHMPVYYYINNHFPLPFPHDVNAILIGILVVWVSMVVHRYNPIR